MKQKGFMKKLSAVLLATAMAVSTFPQLSTPVFAADTTGELPIEQFATVEQLKSFNTNDNDGTKNSAKVYFGNNDQKWWIAGSQQKNGLTLFAASPLATEVQFEDDGNNKTNQEEWSDCSYPTGITITEVYPNHYGASDIRNTTLKGLETNTNYFSTSEQMLMSDTEVTTGDVSNESFYKTIDKLYLAYGETESKYITVGSGLNDGLRVDMDYWGSQGDYFWLRVPLHSNRACRLWISARTPGDFMSGNLVSGSLSLVPAFELNLSSVLFGSAALSATNAKDDGTLEVKTVNNKDIDGAFTLRYHTGDLGSAEVSFDKSKVKLTNIPTNKKVYLVAQNRAGAKAKQITNETEVSARDMGLDSFANCKVWVEKTDTTNRMTYATLATEEQGYDVNVTASAGLNITSNNGAQEVASNTAITDIAVEVADGYYLPDDYISNLQSQLNGLSVSKTDKGFTISGTPTSDVNITLPAATVLPKSDTPVVEFKTTSTSITATVTNHKDDFGDIEYKWNGGNWEKDKNTLSNLQADTTYKLAVRFTGNGFYQPSDEYSVEITTLKDGNTVIVVPTDLTTTYKEKLKLSDVDLSGTGWTWVDGNTALLAGKKSYPATFDTTDLENTTDFSGVDGYDPDTHKVTRDVQVEVKKADSMVTITTLSLDKAYDGNVVSEPEYTTSGSDGKVTITWQKNTGSVDTPKWEDLKSTPSSVGNYQVIVSLAGNDNYNSASATLDFTISKADNAWAEEVSITGWTYNETANVPTAKAKFGEVTFTYSSEENGTYTNEVPKNAGTWYVKATVAGTENYTGLESVVSFVIAKSDTDMSVSLKDNKTDYVYGDTIGLTVLVAPRKAKTVAKDKVAVFVGENQITDAVDVAEGTPTSISVNTADETVKKYLKPSEYEITLIVKYGGSDNLNEEVGSVSIQLAKKDTTIKFKDSLTLDKTYDGQPVELKVAEEIQKDGSSKDVTISWQTADGKELDEAPTNAGTYKVVASVEADEYYKAASIEKTFNISKATPTPDKITGLVLGQGRTLEEVELPDGFAWKDKTQTADELGQHEFEAIFTPQDSTNYEQVEVMISVEVVPNLTPMNRVPTIEASDKELTVGDEFDPLEDVTAEDKEDGDLTSKIEVVENEVDTSKAGTYEVTYKVTDSQGAIATKTMKVVVKAKEKPTVPEKPDEDEKPEKPDADKPATGDNENPPAIKTGDETNLGLWTTVFVISGLGIAVMTLLKRRKYNR